MADTVLLLARDPPQEPLERKKLYDAARQLMFQTEDRHDITHRLYFSGWQLYLADIATDLAIFTTLIKEPGRLWAARELADRLDCDAVLLNRILRGLAAYGMAAVNSLGQYGPAPATYTLADPGVAGCVRHNVITATPIYSALPEFLRINGHKNPDDVNNASFQLAFKTDLEFFNWVGSHPENLTWATVNMAMSRAGQETWIGNPRYFPAECFQLSQEDIADNRVLLVDIGAGAGHQSIAFRQSYPDLPGRVVIQDLAHTIARGDKEVMSKLNIEPMEHNFMDPQPLRAARVYYMRNVLHDWPDIPAHTILSHVRNAMAPDSVLIIEEMVVKEPETQWQQVNYDLAMMSVMSAMERTAQQWKCVFEATGFRIKEIREYDSDNGDSLIIGIPV